MESQEWCLEYPRRVLEGPSSGLKGQGRGLGSGISLHIWPVEGFGRPRLRSGGPRRGLEGAGRGPEGP